jgi:thiamine biosynthesis protein ThiS
MNFFEFYFLYFLCLFVAMNVYVNGELRDVDVTSLAELITQLDLPVARIAIELNREVVRRGEWGSTMLKDEDRIEIVHFVGGGGMCRTRN